MPFLVFLFLLLIAAVGYFAQLNPSTITFFVTRDTAYSISLMALILFAVAVGGFLVMISSGVRQTKALYLNWSYRKRQKKEAQVDLAYKTAMDAYWAQRNREAMTLFQKVLSLFPNHIPTLIRLGEIYRVEKNLPEAIRLHRTARLADHQNIEALLQLAQDLETAEQYDEAIAILKEITSQDEAHRTALIRLRDLLVHQVRWEEAQGIEEKIMKLPLTEEMRINEQGILTGILFEKGMTLLKRNQAEAARRAMKSAIKMDKGFIPAYVGLAEVYLQEGKTESSMTLLEKGYEITQNIILLHRLEELCMEMGQPDRILKAYQQGTQKNPKSTLLKFYLGKLYYRLEMVDQAVDLLGEIHGHLDFPDLQKTIGDLHMRRGEFLLAAETFRRGLDLKTAVPAPYACLKCHHQTTRWSSRCHSCGQWNTSIPPSLLTDKEEQALLATPLSSSFSKRPAEAVTGEIY